MGICCFIQGEDFERIVSTVAFERRKNARHVKGVISISRYTFIFLLKSRHPPMEIIQKFFKKFGVAKELNKITTNPNGILSKSSSLQKLLKEYGYTIEEYGYNPLDDIQIGAIRCTVRTDNGTELAGSKVFREAVNDHEYILETTAPEATGRA